MRIFSFFLLTIFSANIMAELPVTKHHFKIKNEASHIKSKLFSNLSRKKSFHTNPTIEFPTQLITFKGKIADMSCDDFINATENLDKKLAKKDIYFLGEATCDDNTEGVIEITYFNAIDGISDEAILFLQDYLSKINEIDFYGIPITVDPVKGVILSLKIRAGIYNSDDMDDLKGNHYFYDKALFFSKYYEVNTTLDNDIENKLLGNNPELITDFIKQWIDTDEVPEYLKALPESNSVKARYEVIFLKDNNQVYLSPFWYRNKLDCTVYPSGKCLG